MPLTEELDESFYVSYAQWLTSNLQDRDAAKYLVGRLRDVWVRGSVPDLYAVMNVVYLLEDPSFYDLLIDGLRRNDERIASEAAVIVCGLLGKGAKFGPELPDVLTEFGSLFPQWRTLVRLGLRVIGGPNADSGEDLA